MWACARDLQVWADWRAAKATYVAEREGAIAGFTDLEPHGQVDMLFVRADYMREGVATALLQHVTQKARVLGMDRLYAEVSITARPVFERQQFVVLAPQTVVSHGETFLNYRMAKTLS